MEEQKTLQECTLEELKVFAYDRISFRQKLEIELQEINAEIIRRNSVGIYNNVGGVRKNKEEKKK